jgi:hypothetical protein
MHEDFFENVKANGEFEDVERTVARTFGAEISKAVCNFKPPMFSSNSFVFLPYTLNVVNTCFQFLALPDFSLGQLNCSACKHFHVE